MTLTEFEHIAQRLRPKLISIAYDFFENRDDAEDVAQEVLLKLWLRGDSPDDNIEGLAVVATKNLCVSIWRKRKRQTTVAIDDYNPDTSSDEEADKNIIVEEQRKKIDDAINNLPRSEQRLIRMKQEGGLEPEEISSITGIPLQSVRSMISSARKKLIKQLKQ